MINHQFPATSVNTLMSYQVLARQWRPRQFSELVGQHHVRRVLINALESQRLHHAYLFTGTRGVGKTTIARILAKSLNCQTKGVSAEPCGTCDHCRDIDRGRFADLLEIDAASRTKVEDTRELLDNIPYAPSRGKYKVYLIDEVHMLSISSFNALLKTLEEPPEHVKFLLATTDPQKLPATILSRCLQFNLKRLNPDEIEPHLQHILSHEKLEFDPAALRLLAHAADGSLRDALSLLDQAIAFGNGEVKETAVREMLGSLSPDQVGPFLNALADNKGAVLMQQVTEISAYNPDYAKVLADLLTQLQQVALVQQVPDALDKQAEDHARIVDLSQRFSPESVQLLYQIALIGRRDLALAVDPRSGFEMVLLRMLAFQPAANTLVMPSSAVTTSATPTSSKSSETVQNNPVAVPESTAKAINPLEAIRAATGLSSKKKS